MDPSKDQSAIDLPLDRLIARALSELEKVGYSRRSLRRYRKVWRQLVALARVTTSEYGFPGTADGSISVVDGMTCPVVGLVSFTDSWGAPRSGGRTHQGNDLIAPTTTSIGTGPVTCRARLGGVLKFYYREAA